MESRFRRVLLSNDDGIDGVGLAVLEAVAAEIADEVWVVAPDCDRSGAACSVSVHEPIRIRQLGPARYEVKGTPADSVLVALRHLMPEPPDLVLSGINCGGNLGDDVIFSGTLGAALVGSMHGIAAVALSQTYRAPDAIQWDTARMWTPAVIGALFPAGPTDSECYSVNFPDVAPHEVRGMAAARQSAATIDVAVEKRRDARARDYFWLALNRGSGTRLPGSDADALRQRRIAITPIDRDHTLEERLAALADRLASADQTNGREE